jgi:hypothetical protein
MGLDNQVSVLQNILYKAEFILVVAKKQKNEQDWIYLIHHMHQPDNYKDVEILHHCEMFEKKNLKGKKYKQMHIKEGKFILHALDIKNVDKSPEVVYDHLNNGFKIIIKTIDKDKYAVIDGLVNVKKTKWSDMDK